MSDRLSGWFAPLKQLFGYPQPTARLILLGLDAAGKTTFLYKIKKRSYSEVVTTIPTIGFNVETLELQNFGLTCWDVGGCDKIRPLWRHYTTGSSMLVFVIDSNDRERINDARDELIIFLQDETMFGLPLLILANKQDLPNAMTVKQVVEKLELQNIRGREWYATGTVACDGTGVSEALDWIAYALKIDKKKTKKAAALQKPVDVNAISSEDGATDISDTSSVQSFNFSQQGHHTSEKLHSTEHEAHIVAPESVVVVLESESTLTSAFKNDTSSGIPSQQAIEEDSPEQIAFQIAAAKKQQDEITRQQTLTSWVERARLELTAVAITSDSAGGSQFAPPLSDDLFLSQVADCTLSTWDHYTHIRLGWIVITRAQSAGQSLQSAFDSVAAIISHFITHSERTNGKSFHATMTHFWCHMIAVQIQLLSSGAVGVSDVVETDIDTKSEDFVLFLQSLFDPHSVDLWSTSLFKTYFSNGVLFGTQARGSVVEPDLVALPVLN